MRRRFDIILGKDFLVSIRAINDYAEGTLSFRSKENKRITLNCTATRDIPNEASNFISALHHIRLRGDGRATEIYHMLGNQEVKQAGQTESNPEEDFVCWTRKVDKDEEYTDKMLLLEPGDIYQQSEHFQEMVVHKNNEVFITHIEQIIEREMQEQPVSPDEQIKQFVGDKRTEHLKTTTADKLIQLLKDKKEILRPPEGSPLNVETRHKIVEGPQAAPQFQRPRRLGPAELCELHNQIQFLLANNYIRPSKSLYGAPILLAPKKNGKLRMATDYRALNSQTLDPQGGLPRISDIFDIVGGRNAKVFSCLDLKWGYWNVLMAEDSIDKTTISTPLGSYDFRVLQFGLKGAPNTFQLMMEQILRPYLHKFCMVYLDDIINLSYSVTRRRNICNMSI